MRLRGPLVGVLVASLAAGPLRSLEPPSRTECGGADLPADRAASCRRLDQVRGEQGAVLAQYALTAPPMLGAYGLILREGVYYPVSAPGGPGAEILPVEARELESKIQDMIATAQRQAALHDNLQSIEHTLPGGAQDLHAADAANGGPPMTSVPAPMAPRNMVETDSPPPRGVASLFPEAASAAEIETELERLDQADATTIAAAEPALTRLAGHADPEIRKGSISLLAGLRKETLAPLFMSKLDDPDADVRDYAAAAMDAIFVSFGSGKGPWDRYIQKAPALLNRLAPALRPNDDSPSLDLVRRNLDNINRMTERQKKEFIGRFDDPEALLALIASSRNGYIDDGYGLHTPEARLIHERMGALSVSKSLSEMLSDSRLNEALRINALAQLNRYNLLQDDLKTDPSLLGALPALLFPDDRRAELNSFEIFSIGGIAWRTKGGEFSKRLVESLPQMRPGPQGDAALFLQLNRRQLTEPQKKIVDEAAKQALPEMTQRRVQDYYRLQVPFYPHWPEKTLSVGLVMTQAEHAHLLVDDLKKNQYALASGSFATGRLDLVKSVAGKEVTIHLKVFPSNEEGWARDRTKVTEEIIRSYSDPSDQVTAFRGHIGDYYDDHVSSVKTQDKAFMNLGCDSIPKSRLAIENCDRCAYFGTTTTAEGAINNVFLRTAVEALARRLRYNEIEEKLSAVLPASAYRFAGSYSGANLWGMVLDKEPDYRYTGHYN